MLTQTSEPPFNTLMHMALSPSAGPFTRYAAAARASE
jgi:hypothetical protein